MHNVYASTLQKMASSQGHNQLRVLSSLHQTIEGGQRSQFKKQGVEFDKTNFRNQALFEKGLVKTH